MPRHLRLALRLLAKSPGFSAVAVFTLAIGIGANTSIFSVTNALLLRPLAFRDPDRLVVMDVRRQGEAGRGPLTYPRFEQISQNARSFSAISAFCNETFNLTGQGYPEQLASARVSSNFFEILGVSPALGRAFRPQEDRPGGDNVVLISDSLWQRRFALDPKILSRVLTLDGKDYSIIGVLAPDFGFALLGKVDLYAPRVFELNAVTRQQVASGVGFLDYIARLAPGVRLSAAQSELNALAIGYRRENPKLPDATPGLMVHAGILRDEMVASVKPAVLVLFGAVSLVLLIACANLASLLLSRAFGRNREIAIRMAIGATRGNIIRQLLAESLLLAGVGGALGLLISRWGTHALASLAEGTLPRAAEIGVDARVLAFTAAASVIAGVIFGLLPAIQVSRPDLETALRSEGRGTTGGRRHHALRTILVIPQVALSTVLLIGAGLLVRNFLQLRETGPGFDPSHLLTMAITLPPSRYANAAQFVGFTDELLRQVRPLPGVRAAAVASALPVNPTRFTPALPEGQPVVPIAERPLFNVQMVSAGYASAMRIPLARGREFTEHDDAAAPRVAMVNQTLARRYWPHEDALGKHILIGRQTAPAEIVGVLGDVRNISVSSDVQPEFFVPWKQLPWASVQLVIRTQGEPQSIASAVRARVLAVDRDQPVTKVRSMQEILEESAAQPRFTTFLLGGLAAAALVLAMAGIYGVIAYQVTERTHEVGIRIALGAGRSDILQLVFRQGLFAACAGVALGLIAAFALTRLMSALLYLISVTDPFTYITGPLLLILIAAAATYIPARRATRVNPIVALK
ncbi:MAG TPA: ABC transporter permease [Candidatus Acidoferrales bacterium]|nr:ABC transporter permease [Candidatus Acidoferrales bacterium]